MAAAMRNRGHAGGAHTRRGAAGERAVHCGPRRGWYTGHWYTVSKRSGNEWKASWQEEEEASGYRCTGKLRNDNKRVVSAVR